MSNQQTSASLALLLGGLFGLLGVAAGAFGAHGLRETVSARNLEIWATAAHYQQVHAVVLVATAGLSRMLTTRQLRAVLILVTVGIILFSGSLYTLVLGGPRWLGAVAPIGGTCLMAGWAALLAAGARLLGASNRD